MLTAIVLILFGLTAAFDWLPGIKTKPVRESVIYGLMMTAALVILFLNTVGVDVNGPSEAIRSVVEAIFPVK